MVARKKRVSTSAKPEFEKFLDFARRLYAREWLESSEHLAEAGCYEWMANHLNVQGTVLEIGTGTGRSTLELAKRCKRVISIEENVSCLKKTRLFLLENDIPVNVIVRGSISGKGLRAHEIKYHKSTNFDLGSKVTLIEGNILQDLNLVAELADSEPINGIACWLIGTHSAMQYNRCIDISETPTPRHYRLRVQNLVYELADRILQPGGVLHIVDRGQIPDTELLVNDHLSGHRDQAAPTSMVPAGLEFYPYDEPQSQTAMQMVMTVPKEGDINSVTGLALLSVRSIKEVPSGVLAANR